MYIAVNPNHRFLEHSGAVFRRRGRTATIADDRTEAAYSRSYIHHGGHSRLHIHQALGLNLGLQARL